MCVRFGGDVKLFSVKVVSFEAIGLGLVSLKVIGFGGAAVVIDSVGFSAGIDF